MNRLFRLFAIVILALGLNNATNAQTPNPNDAGFAQPEQAVESDGGDPLYGYVACGFLCAICIFAVSKSSRRS